MFTAVLVTTHMHIHIIYVSSTPTIKRLLYFLVLALKATFTFLTVPLYIFFNLLLVDLIVFLESVVWVIGASINQLTFPNKLLNIIATLV